MALVLPNSIFFHVGRTAGHWVRKVVKEMDIPAYEIGAFHDWPAAVNMDALQSEKLRFCFIRHPLDWLRSYWTHEMQFGWDVNAYSEKLVSDNFAEFLCKAIEYYPDGPVSAIFDPFISQCHEVGRQENLAADLLKILTKAKENITPSIIQNVGVTTVEIDSEIRQSATAPKALLEKVLKVESQLYKRWGYLHVPPNMIGPEQTCLAPYILLRNSKNMTNLHEEDFVSGVKNAFAVNETRISGIKETRRTTMLIKKVLEDLEFEDKEVIDLSCSDGVFCFFAETKGAARVVGVDRMLPVPTVDVLKESLDSKVKFYTKGLYGVENSIEGKFDIAFCFQSLETLRYPFLAFRTLSRLMKEGGELILECGIIDGYNEIPILLVPVGSECPMHSNECTYFNLNGLKNALSSYGFYDFKIHSTFRHGFDKAREFSAFKFESDESLHDSDSSVGRALLSCRWSAQKNEQDPRYLMDGIGPSNLIDLWDCQLPVSGLPQYQQDAETAAQLRKQFYRYQQLTRKLEEELVVVKNVIKEREQSLHETINQRENIAKDLIERTNELICSRRTVVERTIMLEQAIRDLQEARKPKASTDNL